MAENETCDVRHSHRWSAFIRAVREGRPRAELLAELRTAMVGSWKAVHRQFVRHGFSIEQVAEAALQGDQAFLDRVYRAAHCHRFVKLIEGCGATSFMKGADDVMAQAVARQLHTIHQQVLHVLARTENLSFPAADAKLAPVFAAFAPTAERYGRALVKGPQMAAKLLDARQPSDLPVRTPRPTTADLLGLSLINPAVLPNVQSGGTEARR